MVAFPNDPPGDDGAQSSSDPTPNEINRRANEIRQRSSYAQRRRRRVQKPPTRWLPPFLIIRKWLDEPPSAQDN